MASEIYISEAAKESLDIAAVRLQLYFRDSSGTHYAIADLHACLVKWLELSIEELADEAFEHCASDRPYAFNRQTFLNTLKQLEQTREFNRISHRDRQTSLPLIDTGAKHPPLAS